jgi:hypothetical protein
VFGVSVTDRSFEMHKSHSGAKDKFDYFVLAIIIAVIAYLTKGMKFNIIGLNIETIQLVSLLIFGWSAISGFKRIEHTMEVYRLNYILLENGKDSDLHGYKKTSKVIDTTIKYAVSSYNLRNRLFLIASICYLGSRILEVYINT